MPSQIDPNFPRFGDPLTANVRNNFQFAHDEIEELQVGKLDLAGGSMSGTIGLVDAQLIDGGVFTVLTGVRQSQATPRAMKRSR